MFAKIGSIISIIKALIDLWRYFQQFQKDQAQAEANKKHEQLKDALKEGQNAKTAEDAWKAQERVVDHDARS